MTQRKSQGLLIASAAAALFAMGAMAGGAQAADEAKVNCVGGNACKGHSDCKTANNTCKGQNACKGQGRKTMTREECDAAGGEVAE